MKSLISVAFLSATTVKLADISGFLDSYRSYHVDAQLGSYVKNIPQFKIDIETLVAKAKDQHWKAIWVELSTEQLALAEHLITAGFQMHSSNKKILRLSKWIREGTSNLPHQQSHYVGVGGAIVKDGKLLLVQEKNGARRGAWGIPGGLVDSNESISDGVAREIREETGLKCTAEDIIFFREVQKSRYDKADLYFVIKMSLIGDDTIKLCQNELLDYRWVPIEDVEQFLIEQKSKKLVLDFYKQLQHLLVDTQIIKISKYNEFYYTKFKDYTVFHPKF